ncbi:MAG TPA: glycosyltransferase [Blastocatellia bacterium]|nr:glycosyltransferase [Blastocatellia bacterium]
MHSPMSQLVSVIVPCYNQAHFLGAAIESILNQTYPHFEIIVVNDGSTDDTAEVAARHPGVRHLYQPNRGLSAARNTGARASRGAYLVFLDADDLLLPNALEDGVKCLSEHPEAGLAYGLYQLMAEDGAPLQLDARPVPEKIDYEAFLRGNRVGMVATGVYRRSAFEAVGGFNPTVRCCEDYELYLRFVRDFPIARHPDVVAVYRQHGAGLSRNSALMLITLLKIFQAQRPYVKENPRYQEAWHEGREFARRVYGQRMIGDVQGNLTKPHKWPRAIYGILQLLRYYPDGLLKKAIGRLRARGWGAWQSEHNAKS